jgi:signal transduction histidine kinase
MPEEALKALGGTGARSLLDILFHYIPLGVAIFDPEFRLVTSNATWFDFVVTYTSLTPDQITPGLSLFDVVPNSMQALVRLRERLLADETVRQNAARLETAEGVSYWDSMFVPVVEEDGVRAIVAVIMNATEREEAYRTLESRVAERTRELAALYDVGTVASVSLDLEALLNRSLERVLQLMDTAAGAIHLYDAEKGVLRLATWRGFPPEMVDRIDGLPLGSGLASQVFEWGEPVIISEMGAYPHAPLSSLATGSEAYVGVPMSARGRPLGVLSVIGRPGHQFDANEVALLDSIADQVGVAVENMRLRQQAEHAAVLKERERLARELHDSVTQSLYSLALFAEAGRRMVQAGQLEQAAEYLGLLGETAQQSLKEMRLLVYNLRPLVLERDGLILALQQRLDAVERRAGIDAHLRVTGNVDLPAPVEEELYRIAQEALNNALKHAGATGVTVDIDAQDEQVVLAVRDNGRGFSVPEGGDDSGGMGLRSMRERARRLGATLQITSASGEGAQVVVEVGAERWRKRRAAWLD